MVLGEHSGTLLPAGVSVATISGGLRGTGWLGCPRELAGLQEQDDGPQKQLQHGVHPTKDP